MPRTYRRRRRRRYRRRRTNYAATALKYGGKLATLGFTAYRNKAAIGYAMSKLAMLNVEVKYHDYAASGTCSVPGSAGFAQLTEIAQGDTQSTRDGNSIKLVGTDFRINLKQAATPTNQRVRFMIIRQGYNDGYTPTLLDLLSSATIDSFRNINESKGYKVLLDKMINLDVISREMYTSSFHFKTMNHVKWDGTSGGDTTFGHLWWVIMTEEATNQATYDVAARIRYVDN